MFSICLLDAPPNPGPCKFSSPPPAPRPCEHLKRGKCTWATHSEFRFLIWWWGFAGTGLTGGVGDNWGSLGDLVFCVSCFVRERFITSKNILGCRLRVHRNSEGAIKAVLHIALFIFTGDKDSGIPINSESQIIYCCFETGTDAER